MNNIAMIHKAGISLGLDILNLQMELEDLKQKLAESDLAKEIKAKEQILYNYRETQKIKQEELKEQMIENGIRDIELNGWKLHIKESPGALDVEDETLIPKKYFKIPEPKPQLDKNLVKKDLINGEAIPGCKIVKTLSLEIKKLNG